MMKKGTWTDLPRVSEYRVGKQKLIEVIHLEDGRKLVEILPHDYDRCLRMVRDITDLNVAKYHAEKALEMIWDRLS